MTDYKVALQRDGEPDLDLTEHLRVLYDAIVGSMDWGSGFLDTEEMAYIIQVGEAIGVDTETLRLDREALAARREQDEKAAARNLRRAQVAATSVSRPAPPQVVLVIE